MSGKQESINRKYAPIPEDAPHHRKRAKKKHVRSDHKHEYEQVAVDARSYSMESGIIRPCFHICTRCTICGRIGDRLLRPDVHEPPNDMPLYVVDGFGQLWEMKVLPDEMRFDG